MRVSMTKAHHQALHEHLFPGDGKEAVALALCGRQLTPAGQERLLVRELLPIPYEACRVREEARVTWDTSLLVPNMQRAIREGAGILKIHSHPADHRDFSDLDDQSDTSIFGTITCALDDGRPHASLIMLPDGELVGRGILPDLRFVEMERISVVGDTLGLYGALAAEQPIPVHSKRTAQAYGSGAYQVNQGLKVGVVGASGTGSLVLEQLARSGVGKIVSVDPKVLEDKHLNRILNSNQHNAGIDLPKVEVLKASLEGIGLGTEVTAIHGDLFDEAVIREMASCDFVIGCMDTADGRNLLNRLSTFYLVPFIDVGVALKADRDGGIIAINGGVHYLQPGGSSLLSRGVISSESIRADALYRTNPDEYHERRREGYIQGVNEDRPAVMPVNMFYSGLAVMEMMARIHAYRFDDAVFAQQLIRVDEGIYTTRDDGEPCSALARHVGRGDVRPILDTVL